MSKELLSWTVPGIGERIKYKGVLSMSVTTIERTKEQPGIQQDTIIPGYCSSCGWKGNLAEANHGSRGFYYLADDKTVDTDVEPVDYCPVCGTEAEVL
jgi:hypothetical protein